LTAMARKNASRVLTEVAQFLCLVLLLTLFSAIAEKPAASQSGSGQSDNAAAAQGTDTSQSPCKGITSNPSALKNSLVEVPKYQKTYVLVVGGSARDRITAPDSPAIRSLSIEIADDSQTSSVVQDLRLNNVQRVPASDQSPVSPLTDLAAGKVDAVIMWAPLAAAGLIDLGLEDKVSLYSVDRPKNPPPSFVVTQAAGAPDACASAIADDLDSFGVLPAELLVPVNIRSLFGTPTPTFSMKGAEQGEQVFQQICARCHGQHAVADPTLAPVDLLVSIRRFQFIGFKYIVLNGRPQKGMPPLRGTVSEAQIALIFQYLQARSKT